MLSDKVEKRVASSIFITLAPPRRDPRAKGDAPLLPNDRPAKAACRPLGPVLSEASLGATTKGIKGSRPGAPGTPHGGCSDLLPPPPPPPHQCSGPGEAEMDAFPPLPPPPPPAPYSNPVSVETLGPDLQKRTAILPSPSLQAPSTFPAELRQPKLLPSTLGQADAPQGEKPPEETVSTEVCAFCHKAISPLTPALEAMKKQYHADCFTCRTCQTTLAGQRYYQKEGRPLCVSCYQDTLEKCAACQARISNHVVQALGNVYHPGCFTCVACGRAIGDEAFAVDDGNRVHCLEDFYRKFAPVCGSCGKAIVPHQGQDSYRIECMGRHFHEDCYRCEDCQVLLSPEPTAEGCYPLGSHLLCKSCHIQRTNESSS